MKLTVLALAAVAMLALTGSALAQSTYVNMNVPFAFTVNNTSMPEGNYSIERTSSPGVLLLAGESKAVLVPAISAEELTAAPQSKLVFKKYGDHYYLWQVWRVAGSVGFEVPLHRSAQMVAQKSSTVEVAAVSSYAK